jgi:hypothetical protein
MINSGKGFNELGNGRSRKQGSGAQIETPGMRIFLIILVKMEKLVPLDL